ncbi:hypothetical protein PDESU_03849 [Pontiella desulfatans]|uniref:UPF0235 protein PDESU_03849 n=1 Tax=Pontiella desulfatans TaxID=2750659 RepID=A0A6C2U639_PONDE|nr:DUF167 family protein [Pontiella desulfatans]VGO15267.1 hypothetical protein PDESU_03849 [Pontiella desulfatans]
MPCFEEKDGCLILNVRAVPRASKDGIAGVMGDALKVRIQAPPVEGKANAYLIKFLSKLWKIPRTSIEILSGETGRNKRLCISNPPDELRAALLTFETG